MNFYLQQIIDWSEVWAPIVPLAFYYICRPKADWSKILLAYLLFALVNNGLSTFFWKQIRLGLYENMKQSFPYLYNADGTYTNVPLYHIGSLVRLLLFSVFFSLIVYRIKKIAWIFAALFICLFFYLFFIKGDIRDFSSAFMATEAALLLIYCLIFYFQILSNEKITISNTHSFWTVTGLSIYVVINFPIFLFYNVLAKQAENFAINIWDIHNISYLVLCLFIAKSFYADKQ